MLTVEFEATTNMPDDEYPLFSISYLFLTKTDDTKELSFKMYDAFCDGYVSDGRMYLRADGCTPLSEQGDEGLTDEEVLSMLRNCPVDVEVDFGGRYMMNEDAQDYILSNPRIVVSSRDADHYLFSLVSPEDRSQYWLLYDENVIEDLGSAVESVLLNVNSIKPF